MNVSSSPKYTLKITQTIKILLNLGSKILALIEIIIKSAKMFFVAYVLTLGFLATRAATNQVALKRCYQLFFKCTCKMSFITSHRRVGLIVSIEIEKTNDLIFVVKVKSLFVETISPATYLHPFKKAQME